LTAEEARELLQTWLDAHPFPLGGDIDDTYDDSLVFEGVEYHTFYLGVVRFGLFDVYVHKETGELFSTGDGEEFSMLPLDIWYEQYGVYEEGEYEEPVFDRTLYYTGITREQLLRYPDDHYYSNVYLTQYTVHEVVESGLYHAYRGDSFNTETLILIDDRGSTGANAIKGDMVTVYGTFIGNETVTWTTTRNGQQTMENVQTPHISVDKLIFNNMNPDVAEFANALVSYLNAHQASDFREHKYLYESTVELGLKFSESGTPSSKFGYRLPDFSAWTELSPDGYTIYEIKYSDPNGITQSMTFNEGQFYKITCSIEYVSGSFPKINIVIENIESY